ncbi:MAG: magnesium and cobalt transport protein CorA [Phenylobacterium sp.]
MGVIAAYVYRHGERLRPVALETAKALKIEPGEFVWIGLHEPSPEELRVLQGRFNLHPLAVEDALMAHQLPKAEVYGDQLFVVARTAHLEGDEIVYGETAIFVGAQHIITVRHGSERTHADLRAQLEAAPSLLKHGVDDVLHAVLDFIVDGYLPIVEEIEEDVLEMERRALDEFLRRDDVARIFQLRRELTRFRRTLGPMAEVCRRLEHLDLPYLHAEVRPYFRDVLDHVRRVESLSDGLKEVLTSVFEASSLLEQQRQGAITRRLAAWAAILAVPTAVAGIYGMNFINMPELHWRYGYFGTVGVIVLVCGLLFASFRRSGWL